MLTKEQIEKFQSLYKNHFKKEIDNKDAYSQGIKLLCLVDIIYKPMTKKDYKKFNKSNRADKQKI
jgi:hypothetical protein